MTIRPRFDGEFVVVRGGGDLATGVVHRLMTAGFPVAVLELPEPLAIRRTVSVATAVTEGRITVDGITAERVGSPAAAVELARRAVAAVLVSPGLPSFPVSPAVVVDARMVKRNIDTTIDQAPLVVGLGPGFSAGEDCHAVVETMRGHRLGRVAWEGPVSANTGIPGTVGGSGADRVVRSPVDGAAAWIVAIGDMVAAGDLLGSVALTEVRAPISGVVRGLISPGREVERGLKIADIDPRSDRAACFEISDKARLVGGGVLEAVFVGHR